MTKFIHIHAKCEAFEVWEQVPENKAVKRLTAIRENFKWTQNRSGHNVEDFLVVKTKVVNPEFQFY